MTLDDPENSGSLGALRLRYTLLSRSLLIVLVLLVVIVASIFYELHHGTHDQGKPLKATVDNAPTEKLVQFKNTGAAFANVSQNISDAIAQLAAAHDPTEARKIFAELRAFLTSLPPQIASREIQAFLASGRDAAAPLDLTISANGLLADASSLRVCLLDYLGRIDRAAAGAIARQILQNPSSPDEWAVSMRNLAWSDSSPETLTLLREKSRALLENVAWRQNPSAGYLEAFDTVVYAKAYDLEPALAGMVCDKDNRAVAHAAYLTLDRLTLADPVAALTPLQNNPDLMQGRELTRANYFARADMRDPQQQALVESYLLDPNRTAQELQTFAGLFPNANYMISQNLLTPTATPSHDELVARDQAALQTVNGWLADPRFASLTPQLTAMQARIGNFVKQGTASGK